MNFADQPALIACITFCKVSPYAVASAMTDHILPETRRVNTLKKTFPSVKLWYAFSLCMKFSLCLCMHIILHMHTPRKVYVSMCVCLYIIGCLSIHIYIDIHMHTHTQNDEIGEYY